MARHPYQDFLTLTACSRVRSDRLLYSSVEASLVSARSADGLRGLLEEAIRQGQRGRLGRAGHGQRTPCVRDRVLGDLILKAKRQLVTQSGMFLVEGSAVDAGVRDDDEMVEGERHASEGAGVHADGAGGGAGTRTSTATEKTDRWRFIARVHAHACLRGLCMST